MDRSNQFSDENLNPHRLANAMSLARLTESRGEWKEALGYCEKALEVDGQYAPAWLLKGKILGRKRASLDEAMNSFLHAMQDEKLRSEAMQAAENSCFAALALSCEAFAAGKSEEAAIETVRTIEVWEAQLLSEGWLQKTAAPLMARVARGAWPGPEEEQARGIACLAMLREAARLSGKAEAWQELVAYEGRLKGLDRVHKKRARAQFLQDWQKLLELAPDCKVPFGVAMRLRRMEKHK